MKTPSAGVLRRRTRVGLAVAWLLATETVILALAVTPVLLLWTASLERAISGHRSALWIIGASMLPGIVVTGLLLLALSAGAARLMRWRTPPGASMPLAGFDWPLLRWACYAACTHVASILVGSWLRGSPVWTWYLRANGASVGKGVYVNSINVGDHSMLTLDDHVVVGSGVHLSGHTVEHGRVITGGVHLGAGVTLGLQCVVGIDVEIGAGTHVAALSLVPKHSRLDAGAIYAGVPVHRMDTPARP